MIDLTLLKEKPEILRDAIKHRGADIDLDEIVELDKKRRALITELQDLRKERNAVSEKVGTLKRQGKETKTLMEKARSLADKIKDVEKKQKNIEAEFKERVQWLPNIPHASVPVGSGSEANQYIRGLREPPVFDFDVLPHWDICEALDVLDLKRAPKISGSRFILYKGLGALLERALINFFLDIHTKKHGYTEISPPVLNPESCLYGTGQFPKLEADMYKCSDDLYLAPTAEVPLTNIHREEIIAHKNLPICYTAYTPCFRREAGSYGKEVRGIKRVHQFNKVELVKYTTPEDGYAEFEKLLNDAEEVVRLLEFPYRIMLLCTGDMTFAAAKTYDIEVYAAGMKEWLEVASISCYEQYQARRANIRYRTPKGNTDYVYTMNGSGVATPRTFIALVENYQTKDGRIEIPEVLRPYINNTEYIE
ncbi:MAG: serine--tRNA ligase [candidate division WOR-3 bacterium]|nr:MAG: serine--tRNA ligase [candidate division WOR-3 bacterium]